MTIKYIAGADLPDLTARWEDNSGILIDFSTGWTFTVTVGDIGGAALITKTSGITGDDADPNVSITWALHELDVLDRNRRYAGVITALRDVDSRERKMPFELFIEDTVGAA